MIAAGLFNIVQLCCCSHFWGGRIWRFAPAYARCDRLCFITLVVVGPKEEDEVRVGMDAVLFTTYLKELYDKTTHSAMGRWLMIEVKDRAVLNDIRHLFRIRIKPRQ